MSIVNKVSAGITKRVASGKALHAAYKKAPGETAMTYAKGHRWGVGLTAVSLAPIHSIRRSSHTGIDNKNA